MADDDFMAAMRKKLDNFPIFEVPAAGSRKKERVSGLRALKAQLTLLQKESGGATLNDLEMLVVMKAGLSDGDQAEVSKLVDAAIEASGGASTTHAAAPHCSSGSSSKNEKAGRQTAKTVASFFA